MSNSWDEYYGLYTDWDDSHSFNVRIELRYEENLRNLGYQKFEHVDDFINLTSAPTSLSLPESRTYIKSESEILISFDAPYDWSIDTDWEDKALAMLGIKEEWVIDSSVDNK